MGIGVHPACRGLPDPDSACPGTGCQSPGQASGGLRPARSCSRIGEVYLSPIGISLVTKIAPARIASMMMGVWFLSSFFGNYLSGYLGTFWGKMPREDFFLLMSGLAFAAGLAFFALLKPLKKAIG